MLSKGSNIKLLMQTIVWFLWCDWWLLKRAGYYVKWPHSLRWKETKISCTISAWMARCEWFTVTVSQGSGLPGCSVFGNTANRQQASPSFVLDRFCFDYSRKLNVNGVKAYMSLHAVHICKLWNAKKGYSSFNQFFWSFFEVIQQHLYCKEA